MLSILCVRLTIKVKVGIPESFKVGWYPPKKLGRVTLNPDFMDFLIAVRWEIPKRICKTVLLNSAVLFVNYACACKTAVLKDSFSNPFRIFQAKGKNENPTIDITA